MVHSLFCNAQLVVVYTESFCLSHTQLDHCCCVLQELSKSYDTGATSVVAHVIVCGHLRLHF